MAARPFQRDQQRFGIHFLQQTLNAAIVDIHQIFEQEHLVDNFLRQLAVEFAHGGNNGFFLLSFIRLIISAAVLTPPILLRLRF